MEIKTESELVLTRDDVLIKKRIAVKIPKNGLQSLKINFQIPIIGLSAKDKAGKIFSKKISSIEVEIQPRHKFNPGTIYGFEISALVSPSTMTLGGMKIIDWPAMDLYKVSVLQKPYQILGFRNLILKDGVWEATGNISNNLVSHVVTKRNARIELGPPPVYYITGKLHCDCRNGGRINKIIIHKPQNTSRHKVTLISDIPNSYEIKDEQQNQKFVIENVCNPGETKSYEIRWKVQFLPINHYQIEAGSMKILRMAIKNSSQLKQMIRGNPEQWNIEHSGIKKVSRVALQENSIFKAHQILFEFCNRRITYDRNGIRNSAAEAFETKIGDCSEFSDLLVALHRAAGIPSRIKEGVIMDINEKLEGHAWVEFLTNNGWIPCDPTWGILLGITSQHIEFQTQYTDSIPYAYQAETVGSKSNIQWNVIGK